MRNIDSFHSFIHSTIVIAHLLCAKQGSKRHRYISEQNRQNYLFSWSLHSSQGRQKIINKHNSKSYSMLDADKCYGK